MGFVYSPYLSVCWFKGLFLNMHYSAYFFVYSMLKIDTLGISLLCFYGDIPPFYNHRSSDSSNSSNCCLEIHILQSRQTRQEAAGVLLWLCRRNRRHWITPPFHRQGHAPGPPPNPSLWALGGFPWGSPWDWNAVGERNIGWQVRVCTYHPYWQGTYSQPSDFQCGQFHRPQTLTFQQAQLPRNTPGQRSAMQRTRHRRLWGIGGTVRRHCRCLYSHHGEPVRYGTADHWPCLLGKQIDTYHKLKLVYDRYKASKDKKKFLRGFENESILFEAVAKEIKKARLSKLPSAEKLKAELDGLSARKDCPVIRITEGAAGGKEVQ